MPMFHLLDPAIEAMVLAMTHGVNSKPTTGPTKDGSLQMDRRAGTAATLQRRRFKANWQCNHKLPLPQQQWITTLGF